VDVAFYIHHTAAQRVASVVDHHVDRHPVGSPPRGSPPRGSPPGGSMKRDPPYGRATSLR